MNMDDLFFKIGVLTVENDILKLKLANAEKRVQELETAQAEVAKADAKAER